MSPGAHTERAFEDRVEHELVQQGWVRAHHGYRPELGIDTGDLLFIGATQQKKWDKLIELYGGDQPTAQRQFAQRLASEIDARGVLDVLRQGVNTSAPATPSPPTQRTTSTRPTACWTSSTTVPDLAGVLATRS